MPQATKNKDLKTSPATFFKPNLTPVSKVMTRRVVTVTPEMTLNSALLAMVTQGIGHLPVVNNQGILVGIVSQADMVQRQLNEGDSEVVESPVVARAKNGVVFGMGAGFQYSFEAGNTVGDLMSQRVVTVTRDTSVAEAAQLMANHRVHGLPVVTEGNRLVGFVSTMDITDWVAQSYC